MILQVLYRRRTAGGLLPLKRYSVAMAGSLTSPVCLGFRRERLNVASRNWITSRMTRWSDGYAGPVPVEKKIDSETPEEANLIE